MMYADIIVDISHEKLDRSFQYRVPLEMEDEIQVGMVCYFSIRSVITCLFECF